MQFFMTFHGRDIKPIKQPVYLLSRYRQRIIFTFRPFKLFFRECLVIKNKTIVFPKQAFDFVSLFVSKGIQAASKRIMAQLTFDNSR
jgi:hypothetical protein